MNFLKAIVKKFTGQPVDWDALEESLIRADLGVPMTLRIIKALQERAQRITITATDIAEVAREEISRILPLAPLPITPLPASPKVLLLVGVNGTGKTTSTAKLAHFFKQNRHSVLLAAADTFRAAAIEQLGVWAERLGVEMIRGQYNADPAGLCYEAYESADRKNIEFLICDTAGRLHTKSNLMAELDKMRRTAQRIIPGAPHETLLVMDATTGQNGLQQARLFTEAAGVTGIVLTKLDGTAKGGVVVAISRELGVPVRYVGVGEKAGDLLPFDPTEFVDSLFA